MLGESCRSKLSSTSTTVNITFVITGIITLAVGILVQSICKEYSELLPKKSLIEFLPPFYIAMGVLTFLVAAFGFYASYNNNNLLICLYAAAVLVMFILKLSASLSGFTVQGNMVSLVQNQLTSTMESYGSIDHVITKQWDMLQRNFECCGVQRPTDWLTFIGTQQTSLPMSCCPHVNSVNNYSCTVEHSFNNGCAEPLRDFVNFQLTVFAITGVITTLMQSLVVVAAVCLLNIDKKKKMDAKTNNRNTER